MALRFKEKVVLVTGGARGIGSAIVRRFAKEGAKVYFTYHSSKGAATALAGSLELKNRVQFFLCDVRKKEAVRQTVEKILSQEERIDVLVNNAGVICDGLFLTLDDEDWRSVLETNLDGAAYFCREVLASMITSGGGKIINISSIVGELGSYGQANYAASKGALNALTKALAAEFASKSVTVNAVSPGMVNTQMSQAARSAFGGKLLEKIPLGYVAEPEEIASVVAFLASQEARYITGQIIAVDGGLSLLSRR